MRARRGVVSVLPAPEDPELREAYTELARWNALALERGGHDRATCEICSPGAAS